MLPSWAFNSFQLTFELKSASNVFIYSCSCWSLIWWVQKHLCVNTIADWWPSTKRFDKIKVPSKRKLKSVYWEIRPFHWLEAFSPYQIQTVNQSANALQEMSAGKLKEMYLPPPPPIDSNVRGLFSGWRVLLILGTWIFTSKVPRDHKLWR